MKCKNYQSRQRLLRNIYFYIFEYFCS